MSTTTFIKTRKSHGHTFRTLVTHTSENASVEDLDQSQRWFQTVGHLVTSVARVSTSLNSADYPSPDANVYAHHGFEVTFQSGAVGFVSVYRDSAELDALVIGTKGYLHGLAVWRKHRNIVGQPVPWAMTKHGPRARLNPNRLPKCCAAELYCRAITGTDETNWGPAWMAIKAA